MKIWKHWINIYDIYKKKMFNPILRNRNENNKNASGIASHKHIPLYIEFCDCDWAAGHDTSADNELVNVISLHLYFGENSELSYGLVSCSCTYSRTLL